MNVDGDVERFGGRKNLPELRVVEILAMRMRIDDGALQAERAHAALELGCRSRGVLRCNRSKAREARGIRSDRRRELVVRCTRERRTGRRVSAEISADAIVIPADGPSFGMAPAGTCKWTSLRSQKRSRTPSSGARDRA